MAVSSILSGILGLLRDRLLAGKFGAGETLDIYFSAFRVPDLLQAILVAGGITAAFLPIFAEEFEKEKERAFKFANNILNFSLLSLLVITIILFFLAPQVLKLITPGFTPEQQAKTVVLTRIIFLSPILFCLSAIFSGILQYFDRFLAYSLAPILYNLGIIAGILFFVPHFGITGLALGVILGAALHVLIQIPAARDSGFHYSKILDLKNKALLKAFKLTIPSAIGSGASQINLMVITALCSTLIPGSIAIFNFSKNLQYLSVGMIGIPFAISIFPMLSRSWAFKRQEKFWSHFSLGLRQILFLTIPASVLIFILRAQIVRIVLGAGLWGWEETRLTAGCLGIFSFSIFAFSVIPFLQKSFYSIQDTKTPTFLQIATMLANVLLFFLFLLLFRSSQGFIDFFTNFLKLENIKDIQVLVFPLALTISGLLHSFSLFLILGRKTKVFKLKEIFNSVQKILIFTILMGVGVWIILRPLAQIFPLATFWGVFFQAIFASLFGILIYVLFAFIFESPELKNLKNSFLKK